MSSPQSTSATHAESVDRGADPPATAPPGGLNRWQTSPGVVVFVGGLVIIFVTQFAARPLWHTDLWDHVNYGQYILDVRHVPTSEPLLPTVTDEPMVNTAWGAQVVMALIIDTESFGLPAMQFLYGLLIIIAIAAVGLAVRRSSNSVTFGILAYLIFLFLNWQQFLIVRPQLVGVTLYSLLLAVLLTGSDRHRILRWALPGLFVVWANLHGSFAMGLFLMGLLTVGRYVDGYFRTHSLYTAFRYRPFSRLMTSMLYCAVAVLINPAGWKIYPEVLRVGRHPNIASMYEWAALSLQMKQGRAFAAIILLLALVLIFTPRRRRATEWVPLLVTAVLTIWSSRMINWFAPVAAYVLCVHAAAIAARFQFAKTLRPRLRGSFVWTGICLSIVMAGCLFTPFGQQLAGAPERPLRAFVSTQTPVETARFLANMNDVPDGLAVYPAEWSGFLSRFGRQKLRPMVNLHVHVIPEQVWNDYLRLIQGPPDYSAILNRYQICLVVVDKHRHGQLSERLRKDVHWTLKFEDRQATVFGRTLIVDTD